LQQTGLYFVPFFTGNQQWYGVKLLWPGRTIRVAIDVVSDVILPQ